MNHYNTCSGSYSPSYKVEFFLPNDITITTKVNSRDMPNAVLEAQKKLGPSMYTGNADSVTVTRL